MTQQDDPIANRLSRIEARLARIEELLYSAKAEQERDAMATQEQCYDAWIQYPNRFVELYTAFPQGLNRRPRRGQRFQESRGKQIPEACEQQRNPVISC